jgi:hypothetical protein
MNRTWNLRDDPANYDDEGIYVELRQARAQVAELQEFIRQNAELFTDIPENILPAEEEEQ